MYIDINRGVESCLSTQENQVGTTGGEGKREEEKKGRGKEGKGKGK